MKIAIPTTREKTVDAHFGHCELYTIFTVSDQKTIMQVEMLPSPVGCGCKSNIAGIFQEKGVSVMLAGNIGMGAIDVLNRHGIQVIRGCEGDTKRIVDAFLNGTLLDSGLTCSSHQEGHTCNH